MLPLGLGWFTQLVVLYRYQEADTDAEQLALTEQWFDAALGELSVVARGQSPPKSLAWQKGFRLGSGLTLRRLGPWLLVYDRPPPVRGVGVLLVVIAGVSWLVALLLLLLFFLVRFKLIGGWLLILRFGLFLTAVGGIVGLLSPCNALPFGLLLGCLLLIRVGVQVG